MDSDQLPLSARFALWFSAWAAGSASLDDARDAIVGADAAHDLSGLGDTEEERSGAGVATTVPLILALGRLRGLGATAARLALPVAGDPLGLAGPADFNAEAVEAGEAVLLDGADLGVVPARTGAGVVWACRPASPSRHSPDPSEADSALRRALLLTGQTLADLDVARWRPEVADELMSLRGAPPLPLPDAMSPRAVRLVALAVRCRRIVELALVDDGGSVTRTEADARRAALLPLDHAARRALVAACGFPFEG